MRSFNSFLLLGMVSVITTACMGPSPVPRGYSSYSDEYKSVEGTKAPSMGYTYSKQKNAEIVDDLRVAAEDLADKLDRKLSFRQDTLYLTMPSDSGFYNTFDYVLRDALAERGYVFSTDPTSSVIVDLVTKDISETGCSDLVKNGEKPVMIALAMNSVEDVASDSVYGIYKLPLYGFGYAGQVDVPMPSCAQ